ncbi:MAG: aspartate kinase [Christensenellales bacterium]
MVKVAKFGGSSLADAQQFRKVGAIVSADDARRYIVPSAPGKRFCDDEKITDMLYRCHEARDDQDVFDKLFDAICDRYREIIADLGLDFSLEDQFETIRTAMKAQQTPDYAASRGEFLSGQVMASYLGFPFVDAAQVIRFKENGKLDEAATDDAMAQVLSGLARAVVPGFYGAKASGEIVTFSRGGSDISGALVARGVHADVYENWTDVCGFMMADPRVVPEAKTIDVVTYNELRELAYMGATVLHDQSIYPVRQAGIPIHILNTNEPEHAGTRIVSRLTEEELSSDVRQGVVTGIAGRKGFTIITLEKTMMHDELGFGRKVLEVLEAHGVSFEHIPSGIDTLSVVVDDKYLANLGQIVLDLTSTCAPDSIEVNSDMAMIATVGQGMIKTKGVAARLFTALTKADVNIRMIDQGSSEMNIIIGVEGKDFETALRAIYAEFGQ